MKKKQMKILINVITCLIITVFVYGCNKPDVEVDELEEIKKPIQEISTIGDDVSITRKEVARMIALTYMTEDEINNLVTDYAFQDISNDAFEHYINAVAYLNIMRGDGISFRPDEGLTIEQAQYIIDKLNVDSDKKLKFDDNTKDMMVSYGLWVSMYVEAINSSSNNQIYDTFGLKYEELVILATNENNQNISKNMVITDKGLYKIGYMENGLIDNGIKVISKGDNIVCTIEVSDNMPTIQSAYIVANDEESISIFCGGVTRRYSIVNGEAENMAGLLCDITINGDTAMQIVTYKTVVQDEIKLYNKQYVEFGVSETIDILSYSDMKVYKEENGIIRWKNVSDIMVGDDNIKFTIKDNMIYGAVMVNDGDYENIRVSINDSSLSNLYHSSVSITSNEEYEIVYGSESVKKQPLETTVIGGDNTEINTDERIYVIGNKIALTSVKRNTSAGYPTYDGSIEIKKTDKGYLVVNDVSFEDYLCYVVPSEMPSSYHKEALKAQAVTARSYAYNQMLSNRYNEYGGNLDDSVSSQVYNNIDANEITSSAVYDTSGEVIVYDGDIVSANFFSTSAGDTSNSGDVWPDIATQRYPNYTPVYLSSVSTHTAKGYEDMTNEVTADKFFRDMSVIGNDSSVSWFRWNVSMTADEIVNSINNNISKRYEIVPFMILTKQGEAYVQKAIPKINDIKDMYVQKRGDGGIIMELVVVTDVGTIKIMGEYNIRAIINPYQYDTSKGSIDITRKDGTVVSNYSIMPSAFYTFDKEYEGSKLVSVHIYGGGNGHGAGMSQNGAKYMAENGMGYKEILEYYYTGVEVR